MTEANERARGVGDLTRGKHDSETAGLRAEIQRLQGQNEDGGRELADYKREIAELKHQLEVKNKDSAENSSELTRLRQQIEQMRT